MVFSEAACCVETDADLSAGREDFAGWIEVWAAAVKTTVEVNRAAGAKSRKGKAFRPAEFVAGLVDSDDRGKVPVGSEKVFVM